MAMIQCPSCKKQISDKISKCPHCGYTLAPEVKQICVKCGAELEDDATISVSYTHLTLPTNREV